MGGLTPGAVLGDRFEVVGVLGHGGMATVYLVEDRLRGEPIALKVLHGHLARSAAMRSRLRREVRAASRIRHPHALVAWDLHDLDGRLAVSMPLHRGRTLQEYVERHGPLTPAALEKAGIQLASVLREAHLGGMVHRDVTPTNVLVDDAGDVMLSDFGLARFTDQRTATGTGVLGTAGYAAPEIYQGDRSDPRSDLYALGAVLYHAATGASPFHASDPVGTLRRQLEDDRTALDLARPDYPPHLVRAVEALLALDPEDRPQGAAEVVEALRGQRELPPPVTDAERPRHHLAPGSWTVVVEERAADRERRRGLRYRYRTSRQGWLEGDVGRVVDGVRRWVMTDVLGMQPGRSPEEQLAAAVSREARLPEDALTVPPQLLERRFRLVERISHEGARRLAHAAELAGFTARPAALTPSEEPPEPPASWVSSRELREIALVGGFVVLGLFLLAATGLAVAVFGVPAGPLLLGPGIVVFVLLLQAALAWERRGRVDPVARLPVAFSHDLRLHLGPDAKVALPPPLDEDAPASPRAAGARAQTAPGPEAPPTSGDRHGALLRRTRAQLDDLERALQDTATDLPRPALRDLRTTLTDLRAKTTQLARLTVAIDEELASLDEEGAATAVDRIQGRLERLRTLSRAGGTADTAEIAPLEAAIAAHRETLSQAERLEGRLTVVLARLLEIGAAAARARMDLLDRRPARSAVDLLERLKRETADASAALAEVEGRTVPRLRREVAAEHPGRRPPGMRDEA